MSYKVKLDVYEGPFELLLDLISKQKVDVYDIPIARITEEYLSYLKKMRELDLEVASEFLLVAATLLEIKASSLLALDEEEELEEEIPYLEVRENLIVRLLEYKKFKNVAAYLASRMDTQKKYFARVAELEERFIKLSPNFLEEVNPEDLTRLFNKLLKEASTPLLESAHITPVVIRVEERAEFVLNVLKKKRKQSFRELTKDCSEKVEIIATFLALLELYKRELVEINQPVTFGEIEVELLENGTI